LRDFAGAVSIAVDGGFFCPAPACPSAAALIASISAPITAFRYSTRRNLNAHLSKSVRQDRTRQHIDFVILSEELRFANAKHNRSRKPALSKAEGDPLPACPATGLARHFYH
jgi:hypothetical protein